jgi:hypothetical protein
LHNDFLSVSCGLEKENNQCIVCNFFKGDDIHCTHCLYYLEKQMFGLELEYYPNLGSENFIDMLVSEVLLSENYPWIRLSHYIWITVINDHNYNIGFVFNLKYHNKYDNSLDMFNSFDENMYTHYIPLKYLRSRIIIKQKNVIWSMEKQESIRKFVLEKDILKKIFIRLKKEAKKCSLVSSLQHMCFLSVLKEMTLYPDRKVPEENNFPLPISYFKTMKALLSSSRCLCLWIQNILQSHNGYCT